MNDQWATKPADISFQEGLYHFFRYFRLQRGQAYESTKPILHGQDVVVTFMTFGHLYQINVQGLAICAWHVCTCRGPYADILLDTHHTGLDPVSDIRIQAWIPEMLQSQGGCSVYPEVSCPG